MGPAEAGAADAWASAANVRASLGLKFGTTSRSGAGREGQVLPGARTHFGKQSGKRCGLLANFKTVFGCIGILDLRRLSDVQKFQEKFRRFEDTLHIDAN